MSENTVREAERRALQALSPLWVERLPNGDWRWTLNVGALLAWILALALLARECA